MQPNILLYNLLYIYIQTLYNSGHSQESLAFHMT